MANYWKNNLTICSHWCYLVRICRLYRPVVFMTTPKNHHMHNIPLMLDCWANPVIVPST